MEQEVASPPVIAEGVRAIAAKLAKQAEVLVKTAISPCAQAYILSQIIKNGDLPKSPILAVAHDEHEKLAIYRLLKIYLDKKADRFPIETGVSPRALARLAGSSFAFFLWTKEEARSPLPSPKDLKKSALRLAAGETIAPEELAKQLVALGYKHERAAAAPGIFARRGNIFDIFPDDDGRAFRLDFDGDKIESIKSFKPGEKKTDNANIASILPASLAAIPKNGSLKDFGEKVRRLIFEPFPAAADASILFTDKEIKNLLLLAGKDAKEAAVGDKLALKFIKNLKPGDHVVHLDHGVARFGRLVEQALDGSVREYFELHYAEGDKLFVPVTLAEKLEKYIGESAPTLNRLSSPAWQKTLKAARADTLSQARELLNVQARRELSQSAAVERSPEVEKTLAKSFPYKTTPDQERVIQTIYDEMAKHTPMDHLVCGDVGFGKTEVAVRAAAKTALEGGQVAVLSPTTILSQQHFDTFTERLKDLPVAIAALSRFQSKAEQAKAVAGLADKKIDIVIGTHRLLSDDVKFADLRLIIIDEEQRFGVKHKEKLKKLRADAHVLTLSATPIPRTLHLALSGVRQVSMIETPPEGRLPIETRIEPHNHTKIRDVLLKELKRGGQAYYLYNNVETIHLKKEELQGLLPNTSFGILHGQLPENEIAGVMHKFDNKEIAVLVCSTIIENGLDLPNVNTLIVDNAVQFGLSQLHQIRGRIGRGSRQAYAYFFYHRHKLTGEAGKRLEALEQAQHLGAGYDLAMKDMEIRGVGNILGGRQHGHVRSIGLGLYLRLLAQAVDEIRSGEHSEVLSDITVDLPIEARIPQYFEPLTEKRIELYHEWAMISDPDKLAAARAKLEAEGALPEALLNLFYILRLKIFGRTAGLNVIDTTSYSSQDREQAIILKPNAPVAPKTFARLLDIAPNWQYSTDELKIAKRDLGGDWKKKLEDCVKALAVEKL